MLQKAVPKWGGFFCRTGNALNIKQAKSAAIFVIMSIGVFAIFSFGYYSRFPDLFAERYGVTLLKSDLRVAILNFSWCIVAGRLASIFLPLLFVKMSRDIFLETAAYLAFRSKSRNLKRFAVRARKIVDIMLLVLVKARVVISFLLAAIFFLYFLTGSLPLIVVYILAVSISVLVELVVKNYFSDSKSVRYYWAIRTAKVEPSLHFGVSTAVLITAFFLGDSLGAERLVKDELVRLNGSWYNALFFDGEIIVTSQIVSFDNQDRPFIVVDHLSFDSRELYGAFETTVDVAASR